MEHFRLCLTLAGSRAKRATVLAAVAFVHHVSGNYFEALAHYNSSLALQPDNALVSELMNQCLVSAHAVGGALQ